MLERDTIPMTVISMTGWKLYVSDTCVFIHSPRRYKNMHLGLEHLQIKPTSVISAA